MVADEVGLDPALYPIHVVADEVGLDPALSPIHVVADEVGLDHIPLSNLCGHW